MYTSDQKKKTAKRLKELRKKRGLTIDKLQRELQKEYNIIKNNRNTVKTNYVSQSSLKDWEVTDEYHSKFDKGYGMGIDYLCALADFYNVSTDYLLGRTDVASVENDIQVACKVTGLSENAISKLTMPGTFNAILNIPPQLIPYNNKTNTACFTANFTQYRNEQPKLIVKTLNDVLEYTPELFTSIAFLLYGDNFSLGGVSPKIKIGEYEYSMSCDKNLIVNGILDMVKDDIKFLQSTIEKTNRKEDNE